jgi:hypothetical protein
LKNSVKILLAFSLVIIILLLFIVFRAFTGSTGVTDSTEANDSTEVAKEMSYLKDTEKLYVVKEYSVDKNRLIEYEQNYIGDSKGYNTWYGADTFLEKENQNGLFYGEDKVLAYPVEKGKEWNVESFTFTIESVNKTVKTPAGTFNNVVEVRTTEKGVEGYSTTYYAKGVGQILRESVDSNSQKTMRFELQEIKEKESE